MTYPSAGPDRVPHLLRAFRALDDAGVRWAMLRDFDLADTGDVDILVYQDAAGRLDALLAGAGYRRLPGAGQGSHRFYLGYDGEDDCWVSLDVVTEVAFGRRLEFRTQAAVALLARAGRRAGVSILSRDDAFWHLLLHYMLDKGRVPPGRHARLAAAAAGAGCGSPLASVLDDLRPGGRAAADIIAAVLRGDTAAVDSLSAPLRRAWRAKDAGQVRRRAIRSRIERIHLIRSTVPPIGTTVAILGPDGAGKTTLAENLTRSVPLPARHVYMGVWREYPWDAWLRWIPGARLAARMARLSARSIESRYHRRRGRLVLLDRFTTDAALPSPDLDWRGRVTASLVRRLSRDPDLFLVLNAPADVMYARKGEQGLKVLARERDAYLRMAARHPSAAVLDATLPPEVVCKHAHRALWHAVSAAPPRATPTAETG